MGYHTRSLSSLLCTRTYMGGGALFFRHFDARLLLVSGRCEEFIYFSVASKCCLGAAAVLVSAGAACDESTLV